MTWLKRIPVSNLIFLLVLPGIVYFFISNVTYQRAFKFIIPGIGVTILAAIGAYLLAAILGLIAAGLLSLALGKHTRKYYAVAALTFALLSVFFFSRPSESYTLAGKLDGRVAIMSGTPARLSDIIKNGEFAEGAGTQQIRSVSDRARALELLEAGDVVTAVFLPSTEVPSGLEELWKIHYLPDRFRNPALFSAVFALLTFLLIIGSLHSGAHPLAVFAELYIDMIRAVPMLVIILYVGFPVSKAIRDASGLDLPKFLRGMLPIAIGYSAYMAEIFRAGIDAIPKGQYEASRSLGLTGWQTARYVILPQALKIVIPPLGNEFIAMLKDTSLLSVLSIRDLTQRTREFQSNTFILFPSFNTVAIIYIALTLSASSVINWIERRNATDKKH
ncbi:MAG: amino acid ABC transporter permease [Deinococcales bacterium]